MKKDYERLLLASERICGWKTPAEVAANLTKGGYEVSEQTMTNWKSRGVSKEGRLNASRIIGCRPLWLETGEGEMRDNATKKNPPEGTDNLISRLSSLYQEYEQAPPSERALIDEALKQHAELRRLLHGKSE